MNLFQYILCCGSTGLIRLMDKELKNFNTSYVVVQQLSDDLNNWFDNHFNTSYVVVQLFWLLELELSYRNFNTSYVVVQLYYRYKYW